MDITIKKLAQEMGTTPRALRARLTRANIPTIGVNDILPQDLVEHIRHKRLLRNYEPNGHQLQSNGHASKEEGQDIIVKGLKHEFSKVVTSKEIDLIKELNAKIIDLKLQIDGTENQARTEEHETEHQRIQNDELLAKVSELEHQLEQSQKYVQTLQKTIKEKNEEIEGNQIKRTWMAMAALPMLALPAAFCVYLFSAQFVAEWVALAEAAAFEATYIGLALLKDMNATQRELAKKVAQGAVLVSVVYATIGAALHRNPQLMEGMDGFWFWGSCALYGIPLGLLGYNLSKLLFNK